MSAVKKQNRTARPALLRQRSERLRVAIIGGGRLGTALGRALIEAGHRLDLVVTKHAASARRAALTMGGRPASFTSRQLEASPDVVRRLSQMNLLIFSTPDDAIEPVTQRLARLFGGRKRATGRGAPPPARIALHTSGALSSEVLAPLRDAGFSAGSMHPLISVAGAAATPDIFRGAYFCIEGDQRASRLARRIVKQLGGQSFSIASETKPLYHAAAAMSSGHLVALLDLASQMLEQCGISPRRAKQILLPLVESTVANLSMKTPAKALTGPLARGDYATARKHLEAMEAHGLADAAAAYRLLGNRAVNLARATGANAEQLDRIVKLLASSATRL